MAFNSWEKNKTENIVKPWKPLLPLQVDIVYFKHFNVFCVVFSVRCNSHSTDLLSFIV